MILEKVLSANYPFDDIILRNIAPVYNIMQFIADERPRCYAPRSVVRKMHNARMWHVMSLLLLSHDCRSALSTLS